MGKESLEGDEKCGQPTTTAHFKMGKENLEDDDKCGQPTIAAAEVHIARVDRDVQL